MQRQKSTEEDSITESETSEKSKQQSSYDIAKDPNYIYFACGNRYIHIPEQRQTPNSEDYYPPY
ncbi:hypothetical protein ACFLX2_00785 [Candidatus Dependentiae bacterium]